MKIERTILFMKRKKMIDSKVFFLENTLMRQKNIKKSDEREI